MPTSYIGVYAPTYGPYQSGSAGGNITPAPPSWTFNTDTRILTLSHATLGAAELEFSYQNAAYQQYSAGLTVDAAQHPAGDWKGRVKAATGRNPSTVAASAAIDAKTTAPAPTISTLTPSHAQVGYLVTLIGTGFGASQGSSTVDLTGTAATVSSWSDQQVEAIVPTGATTGRWHFTTAGGTATSPSDFTVDATAPPSDNRPTITSFAPATAGPGETVVLTGTNFTGATPVTLNSQPVTSFVVNSPTKITAVLPQKPSAGPWRVTANGKTGQSLTNQNITQAAFPAGVKRQIRLEGDSQMFQYLGNTGDGGMAANIRAALGTTSYGGYNNEATPSEEIGQHMIGEIPAQFGLPSAFYYDNLAVLYAGINDIIHHADSTGQQVYQYAVTWHQQVQAIGFLTVACTLCYYNQGNDGAAIARVNAVIDDYNNRLRANNPGSVLADVNADPRLDPRTHPENFNPDGLHLNYSGGTQLAANIIVAALKSLPLSPAGSLDVDKTLALFFGTAANAANAGHTWVDESGHGADLTSLGGVFALTTDAQGQAVWRSQASGGSFLVPITSQASSYEVYALVNVAADIQNVYFLEDPNHSVILTFGTDSTQNPNAYFLGSTNQFLGRFTLGKSNVQLARWVFDSPNQRGGAENSAGNQDASVSAYPTPFVINSGGVGMGRFQGDIYAFAIVPRLLTHQQAYAWSLYLAQQAGLTL